MTEVNISEAKLAMIDSSTWRNYIDAFIAKCAPDDPPFLSDLLAGIRKGGQPIMEELGALYDQRVDPAFKWKIKVMRDEWGNEPEPGDKVVRKIQKPLFYGPGKPVPAHDINIDKVNGEYEKKWISTVTYVVDSKGCIVCEFRDAVYFLRAFGIHSRSKHKLCRHKDPHSLEPAPTGKINEKGEPEKLHVWYHRYREVTKQEYETLPEIEKIDKPKRGRPAKTQEAKLL